MNHLYYGDNLTVLRDSIASDSVDLVYLDPPFNSNASYNVLFKAPSGEQSAAQIEAFGDTWHWNDEANRAIPGRLAAGLQHSRLIREGRTSHSADASYACPREQR